MTSLIALPLAGFLIGMLVVMMGGGGGALYVGILTVGFNVPPAVAAASSLATIIPTMAMGAFSHYKAGNVNLRYGMAMLVGGSVGAVLGSLASPHIPPSVYTKLTGLIMLALTLQLIVSQLRKRQGGAGSPETKSRSAGKKRIAALGYGLLGGTISGLAGLSGASSIVVGLGILGCGVLEMVGTSTFVLTGISLAGFIAHLSVGSVDWKLVLLLTAGTVSGAAVGPLVLKRLDKAKFEKVLGPFMIVTMIGMSAALLLK
jgi:Predicted permeases